MESRPICIGVTAEFIRYLDNKFGLLLLSDEEENDPATLSNKTLIGKFFCPRTYHFVLFLSIISTHNSVTHLLLCTYIHPIKIETNFDFCPSHNNETFTFKFYVNYFGLYNIFSIITFLFLVIPSSYVCHPCDH